ncbi:MAG: hypothetical protein RIE58_02010 [Vicingaceae bacterium]
MLNIKSILFFVTFLPMGLIAQENKEAIKVISRPVEGEIRTLYNDTIYGKITIRDASDKYITSIIFKEKGRSKMIYSAHDISRFRQVVPFPDRAEFGVEEVYYESRTDPSDPYKKHFYPIDEWK